MGGGKGRGFGGIALVLRTRDGADASVSGKPSAFSSLESTVDLTICHLSRAERLAEAAGPAEAVESPVSISKNCWCAESGTCTFTDSFTA